MRAIPAKSSAVAARMVTGASGEADFIAGVPLESFRHMLGARDRGPVASFNARLRRNPAIAGNAEHAAALNHLPARLWEGRGAEFHAARERASVPGRNRPAVILFPNSEPGEIGAPPHIAERQASGGRKRREVRGVAMRIEELRGVSPRARRPRVFPHDFYGPLAAAEIAFDPCGARG